MAAMPCILYSNQYINMMICRPITKVFITVAASGAQSFSSAGLCSKLHIAAVCCAHVQLIRCKGVSLSDRIDITPHSRASAWVVFIGKSHL